MTFGEAEIGGVQGARNRKGCRAEGGSGIRSSTFLARGCIRRLSIRRLAIRHNNGCGGDARYHRGEAVDWIEQLYSRNGDGDAYCS